MDIPNQSINIHYDDCFCGSGKKIVDCCFAPIDTTPPPPKSEYSNPRCYAHSLNDCSSHISKEHYFSKSILEIFSPSSIDVSNFAWLDKGKSKSLSINALSSKVLCERHNEALSPLDTLAKKFFSVALGKAGDQWAIVLDGFELERWMLKLYCGCLSSGLFTYQGKPLPKELPSTTLLETLFYRKPIPQGRGLLCVLEKLGEYRSGMIAWGPLIHEDLGLIGLDFRIEYIRLQFSFVSVADSDREMSRTKGIRYHPNSIIVSGKDVYRELHFGWPEGGDVTINLHD